MQAQADRVESFRRDAQKLAANASDGLGLAVSGGPDSVALLLLASAAFPGSVRAATVDHGLRREAADEAAFVESLCTDLGIGHDTLRPSEPLTGNIQSSARGARYALLEDWRRRKGLAWLATAHHCDDQAETLLMRLNRGSGVGGLSGIRAVNGTVIRPLLNWRRAELVAVVEAAGIEAVCDPSNADERFDRVRIRRRLAEAEWLDPASLARSASALAEAEDALNWATEGLWLSRATKETNEIRLSLDGVPAELRRRLVHRALLELAPYASIRGEDLGRLIDSLNSGRAATLGGVLAKAGTQWRFSLAPPRRA